MKTYATGLAILVLAACSSTGREGGFDGAAAPPDPAFSGNAGDCAIQSAGDPESDFDGDGYALKDDCNECSPQINRGAHDIPSNGIDEDCSGAPDDEVVDCDSDLSKETSDGLDGAKAIGLCKIAGLSDRSWGVVSAKWIKPDGTPLGDRLGLGILKKFGVNRPRAGGAMLALSSGQAREPSDPDYLGYTSIDKGYKHGTPAGYPKESPACPGVITGPTQDGVALELKVRVPSNARSFSYQQNFFTIEYPNFICREFNDFFVTILTPSPPGLPDANIAYDQDKNPIGVNSSLLQVCEPGTRGDDIPKVFSCPLGPTSLAGTGFGIDTDVRNHAATGWLTTSAPVEPGSEITLRFAIWDSGDGSLDSTVLIDDFKFAIDGIDGPITTPSGPR